MERFKRVFVVVLDSLGVGAMADSPEYGDVRVDTLGHISQSVEAFHIPNLQKLGLANLPTPASAGRASQPTRRAVLPPAGGQPG